LVLTVRRTNFAVNQNTTMSIVLIAKNRDLEPLKQALETLDPHIEAEIWPGVKKKDRISFAVCWNHPAHVLEMYPNLKVISSLGAGVDHLLSDPSLEEHHRICRVVTPSLGDQLSSYVLNAILNYRFNTANYIDQQRKGNWKKHDTVPASDCHVGILGLGEMGSSVAKYIKNAGYEVSGWSRSPKKLSGIHTFSRNELSDFLQQTHILVCCLPLTTETEGILDLELFQQLKDPSYLINVGRGKHLVEEDLIYALKTGTLAGACLDVFSEEPLPENHIFWNRPGICITPHIASITDPEEAAPVILENYKRMLSGMDLLNEVDRDRGY